MTRPPDASGGSNDIRLPRRRRSRAPWRRRRDWGAIVAKVLCALFAVAGALPLGVGFAARTETVQRWLATETSATLRRELGVEADYELVVQPWPLELRLDNVVVEASDGGEPFMRAQHVVARPRIFSLLAGKVDIGEVDVESPRVRAVVRDGALANLRYRLPEPPEPAAEAPESTLPLSAVSVTNGWLDLTVDDNRIRVSHLDADVTTDRGPIELKLRTGLTRLDRVYPTPGSTSEDNVDEDSLCRVDLRAQLTDDEILVRRLRLLGAADLDPAPDSRPPCDLPSDDWRRFELKLESLRVRLADGSLESMGGRVLAQVPAALAHRFVSLPPVTGWVMVDLEARYDGTTRLPSLVGRFGGRDLSIDGRYLAHSIIGDLDTSGDRIKVTRGKFSWASSKSSFREALIDPFAEGVRLDVHDIEINDLKFEDMLDDLAAHPRAHVGWSYDRAEVEHFGGTIEPLDLSGKIELETTDFAVYDRPTTDPLRWRIIGVPQAKLSGTFKVTPSAIVLANFTVATGRSRLTTTVSLGFEEVLGITVSEGSEVDLRDISPLADIPMSGTARIKVDGRGEFNVPIIDADMAVRDFVLAGFPLGHIERSRVHFEPLAFDVLDGRLQHDGSAVDVPRLHMDFDAGADVVMQVEVDTRTPTGLKLTDFFEMVRFDDNPTFQGIEATARGTASVDFVLGGKRDRCGGGRLQVRAQMDLAGANVYGEPFESGSLDGDLLWDDMDAGEYGLELDVRSGVLRKGSGTIVGRGSLRHGGKLQADVTATSIPLDRLSFYEQTFGPPPDPQDATATGGVRPEATLSLVAAVAGQLDAPEVQADLEISSLRIGPDTLPPSTVHVKLEPVAQPAPPGPRTRCGHRIPPAVRAPTAPGDPVQGIVTFAGSLFGDQVAFDDLQITQQRAAMLSGGVRLDKLDLGALSNLLPDVAFSRSPPSGQLTGTVQVDEMPLAEPALAEIRVFVDRLVVSRYGHSLQVDRVEEPVVISGDSLRIPEMPLLARFRTGLVGELAAGGTVDHLSSTRELSVDFRLEPVDLATLGMEIAALDRAEGQVQASLHLAGTTSEPKLRGRLSLQDGALRIKGFPLPLDDIDLDVRIVPGEIRVRRAVARTGASGHLALSAKLPFDGLDLTGATATLVARNVKVPIADGVRLTADAMLTASYVPGPEGTPERLPNVTGTVSLTSFSYTRPMSFSLDLDRLTGGGPTDVETYNPDDDWVTFDINLVSPAPLKISNNLLDMKLEVAPPGLRLMGTNQRFGGRGSLRLVPGSKLFLQGHDFSVRDGTVQFDNPTRIAPRLDVHAHTTYRRYSQSAQVEPAATAESSSSASSGGQWRIEMHAFGDTDSPQVRFSSDPPLSQEDIVLLLQVGMTRAELDRGLAGSLAQSVGLVALTSATGIDQALRSTVPVIDEFQISSQYSSRTGRTEPTATVGKRITDDVRASVTTGLTDNREVRSNVEWRLGKGVSVEGSYDNVNNISSSGLGNLGADLRWRLEFE
ncbi:MAG: translocation/assembly module TamB domain-containing protein [Deltaproteobacteria bacterium]|nr:translocation/assembly module TamB domain-containing protein [Deltaproteobacteria bacterium]